MDGELDELEANAAAVRAALAELEQLGSFLNERVGPGSAPDLSPIANELKAIGRVLSEQLARRGIGSEAAAIAGGHPGGGRAALGEIASREDIVRALDKMCDYFQRHEPSSPVPLLLRRAQRLIAKDFMEILRDLTPDGVQQARFIGGIPEDQ
jgi:type VI secretion system protein ImpA